MCRPALPGTDSVDPATLLAPSPTGSSNSPSNSLECPTGDKGRVRDDLIVNAFSNRILGLGPEILGPRSSLGLQD